MTLGRLLIHATALCLALLAGCGFPGKPHPANRPVPSDQVTDFAALYGMYCAGCHGADGRLGPAPPLNDAIFLAIIPDAELVRLVDEGRKGTQMPGFSQRYGGTLTDEQVRAVAKGIKPKWSDSAGNRTETVKIPDDLPTYAFVGASGAAVDGAVARGQKLFAAACAVCHGDEGAGGGVGRLNDSDFLALVSNQMLRRIIITGRPDLGMPDFATIDGRGHDFRPLSSADIDDLVALLASWRGANSAEPSKTAAGGAARGRGHLTEASP